LWLESAAGSAIDFVHQGCRQLADGCLEAGLVEGDQGGDVDTESSGRPETAAGRKTLPGMAAEAVCDVMIAATLVFRRLTLTTSENGAAAVRHSSCDRRP
jgi:hypothetical protein